MRRKALDGSMHENFKGRKKINQRVLGLGKRSEEKLTQRKNEILDRDRTDSHTALLNRSFGNDAV